MAGRLAGRVAFITGSGMGIGREAAVLFAEEGAGVVVADIDAKAAKETVALVERRGGGGPPPPRVGAGGGEGGPPGGGGAGPPLRFGRLFHKQRRRYGGRAHPVLVVGGAEGGRVG